MEVFHIELLKGVGNRRYHCSIAGLKAKCARRRGKSDVLFKNEHDAQARARWHVRSRHAGLGRRTKNFGFS